MSRIGSSASNLKPPSSAVVWVLFGCVAAVVAAKFVLRERILATRWYGPSRRPIPARTAAEEAPVNVLRSSPRHNQWEAIRSLGRGSFGYVTLVRHVLTGQYAAVKDVSSDGAQHSVERELELLLSLPPHRNIVRVLGVEAYRGRTRLFLEYCPNGSLLDVIRPGTPMPEPLVRAYVSQVLEGVAFLHSRNILHRDIKPANVLVDAHGVLKLADFGLSRHLDSLGSGHAGLVGSPAYMSPESIRGVAGVGSDLWAVGATMVHMLSGHVPWSHVEAFKVSREALLLYVGAASVEHPLIPSNASDDARELLRILFDTHPARRGTALGALTHPFFTSHASHDVDVSLSLQSAESRLPHESTTLSTGTSAQTTLAAGLIASAAVI